MKYVPHFLIQSQPSKTPHGYSVNVYPFQAGVICQLTGQSDGICPGDDVIFTCVGGGVTVWTFNQLGEPNRTCTYLSSLPDQTPCNPQDERFRISQTEGSANNNSSLSVASITEILNTTMVGCTDGIGGNPVGTDNICIVGTPVPQTSYAFLRHFLV